MRNRTIDSIVTGILDDLEVSRSEAAAEIETLPELPAYVGHVCSMREERHEVQEDSFLNLLITGAMFR